MSKFIPDKRSKLIFESVEINIKPIEDNVLEYNIFKVTNLSRSSENKAKWYTLKAIVSCRKCALLSTWMGNPLELQMEITKHLIEVHNEINTGKIVNEVMDEIYGRTTEEDFLE